MSDTLETVLEAYGNKVIGMGAGGGGGHSIIDAEGTTMAQEDSLQFADAFLTDDDVNGKTVIENIKEHDTKADYDQATEDGFHVIDDGEDAVIHPSSDDYVEVTADGVKNIRQLLDELFALCDTSKISRDSVIVKANEVYAFQRPFASGYMFVTLYGNTSSSELDTIIFNSSNSRYLEWSYKTNGNTITELSTTQVLSNGTKVTLYYGNKKAVVDLQTTANRCLMQSGANVQETLRNMRYYDVSIGNGSSITLNIDQTDRFTIYLNHSSNTNRTYIGFGCGGSNAHIEDIIANASITKTAGSKTITLTNNTGGSISGWIEILQTGAFSIT